MQTGFYFDQSRCIGCYNCVAACRSWNQLNTQMPDLIKIVPQELGEFPNVSISYLFFTCFHCAEPACVSVCSLSIIEKRIEDGIVIIGDPDKCEDCQLCVEACPYDAINMVASDTAKPLIMKCHLCLDRLNEGKAPACITSCPVEALDAGPMEKLIEKYGEFRELEGFPDYRKTNPSINFRVIDPAK